MTNPNKVLWTFFTSVFYFQRRDWCSKDGLVSRYFWHHFLIFVFTHVIALSVSLHKLQFDCLQRQKLAKNGRHKRTHSEDGKGNRWTGSYMYRNPQMKELPSRTIKVNNILHVYIIVLYCYDLFLFISLFWGLISSRLMKLMEQPP